MGREIKRVALDFDYPINQMIWVGYWNPYSGMPCKVCDQSGMSPEYKKLSDDWFGFDCPENRWCHKITDDEAQALFEDGRLRGAFERCPTGEQVNQWAENEVFGHDSINQWICVRTRAERLGITETDCPCCKGEGVLWPDEKYKKLCEEWQCVEPPEGEGYQLWSTTTEGTPMSPVFATPEELARWLTDSRTSTFASNTASYEQWLAFINGPGWAPSGIMQNGHIESGVTVLAK